MSQNGSESRRFFKSVDLSVGKNMTRIGIFILLSFFVLFRVSEGFAEIKKPLNDLDHAEAIQKIEGTWDSCQSFLGRLYSTNPLYSMSIFTAKPDIESTAAPEPGRQELVGPHWFILQAYSAYIPFVGSMPLPFSYVEKSKLSVTQSEANEDETVVQLEVLPLDLSTLLPSASNPPVYHVQANHRIQRQANNGVQKEIEVLILKSSSALHASTFCRGL